MSDESNWRIRLFDGVRADWFSIDAVRVYLEHWLPWLEVDVRADILIDSVKATAEEDEKSKTEESLSVGLCAIRVLDPSRQAAARQPLKPERDYEQRLLTEQTRATLGVVYDGYELQRLALSRLPSEERGLNTINIWFTERVIATWDEHDRRYHARVSAYGYPSIVSTSGMVVAPAKDKEYYLARRLGIDPASRPEEYAGRFLRYRDAAATEIAKGYAMQAVFYGLVGDPFCDEPSCRLFNAHWQREMIDAQLGETDYCASHEQILAAWQAAGSCTGAHLQQSVS